MEQSVMRTLPIYVNLAMSVCTYFLTVRLIPRLKEAFLNANLFGIDMNKKSLTKM
jgi:UDP-N-acetylglucosamine--dolichyl-phosphate N-acetylglucosaminephosphotransferase